MTQTVWRDNGSTVEHLRDSSEESRQLLPLNHPLRGFYRAVTVGIGVALIVLGVAGFALSSDVPFFGEQGDGVLWYSMNRAAAVCWVCVGALLVGSTLIGRNVGATVTTATGGVLLVVGLLALATIRTDLNVFAFTVTNVIATFAVGLVVLWAGMHTWVGPGQGTTVTGARETLARDPRHDPRDAPPADTSRPGETNETNEPGRDDAPDRDR